MNSSNRFKSGLAICCCVFFGLMLSASALAQTSQVIPASETDGQAELAMAAKLQTATRSQWADWLGPLAPIALSPFFGITCLAGLAQFGGDWLPANALLQNSAMLKNPTVFWVFASLTLVTSLPRLTKVSKPAAQAVDLLETYAGIIILLAIRFLAPDPAAAPENAVAAISAGPVLNQMGVIEFTADALFAVAAAINILVINSVKFLIEILVWLIPIPTVDAILEGLNKLMCGGLMALYSFSPLLATILNLAIFAVSLFVFIKVNRRIRQLRSLIAEPLWSMISKSYGTYRGQPLVVFNQSTWEGLPPFSRLILVPVSDGWELHGSKWWLFSRTTRVPATESKLTIREGLIINTIAIEGNKSGSFTFSRRFRNQTQKLCDHLRLVPSPVSDAGRMTSNFKLELP